MRSLLKILKPGALEASGEPVLIPDTFSRPNRRELHPEDNIDIAQIDASTQAMYEAAMEKAKEEAQRLNDRMMDSAQKQTAAMLSEAQQQAEELREQARQEGYQAGLNAKTGEIDQAVKKLDQSLRELRRHYQAFLDQYSGELKNLALDVASRILSHQITVQETEMEGLVKEAVSSIKDSDWVTVELSQKMSQLVYFLEGELNSAQGKQVKIVTKDLPPGSCIIKTSGGVVDASIATQLANLREYFNQE